MSPQYELISTKLADELEQSGLAIVHKTWLMDSEENKEESAGETKFLHSFYKGYSNRPSKHSAGKTSTVPDPLVLSLLHARIGRLSDNQLQLIGIGHKVAMAAENIIGKILEEYIHFSLINHGWSICWGNCITAVDLCSDNGDLIQIKNRTNTENSSSNKIRNGSNIQVWHRMNAHTGETNWKKLNEMTTGMPLMSEDGFTAFAINLIRENPSAIYISQEDEFFLEME